MKWSALWRVLKVLAENAPAVIEMVGAVKGKEAPGPGPSPTIPPK